MQVHRQMKFADSVFCENKYTWSHNAEENASSEYKDKVGGNVEIPIQKLYLLHIYVCEYSIVV